MNRLDMNPIKKQTTKEIVYDEIKSAILTGKLNKEGYYTETFLAETLQTSRTPVREAANDLVKEGLLLSYPRKGYKVKRISSEEREQIIFLRTCIEEKAISTLQTIITEKQLKELDQILDKQREAMQNDDRYTFIEYDQLMHRTFIHMAGLNIMEDIFEKIYTLMRLIGHTALMKQGRMNEVIQEHGDIIEAMRNNNFERASNSLVDHLEQTHNIVQTIQDANTDEGKED